MPFGLWLRKQRRLLDLTQEELAQRVGCAVVTIRKFESGERKPSKQIASRFADIFLIPQDERALFIEYARSEFDIILPGDQSKYSHPNQSQTPWRVSETLPANHNLPVQLTSFIGREGEVKKVRQLLEETRLLTLTGSGGCGKTRLSLQATFGMLEVFPDGIWFIELASLTDATLIPQAIAAALGIQDQARRPMLEVLGDYLAKRQMLLIVDNCEHLIEECARCVLSLLRSAPSIRIIATSREPLGLAGEAIFYVPSLNVPDPDRRWNPEKLAQFEAVRLFVDRAASGAPGFSLTENHAQSIAEICVRLDGIPLAIELASARTKYMPVEQIVSRLDDRFQLLTGGNRGTLPRHQTLRAAIDWSYDLLSEGEQVFFRRLSAFTGGWTLEAAAAVCTNHGVPEMETLDQLARLVDKSLVLYSEQSSRGRYRMLETVRQYAMARLEETGEMAAVRQKHAEYFLSFAEKAAPYLMSVDRSVWLEQLDEEHSNLRTALSWFDDQGAGEPGLALSSFLWRFWEIRGHLGEGRKWLERMLFLAHGGEGSLTRASALLGAGAFAFYQGDYSTAEARYAESLHEYRTLGDRSGVAWVLIYIAWMTNDRGDFASARSYAEESLALFQEIDEQQGMAWALGRLGLVEFFQGNFHTALPYLKQSVAISHKSGDKMVAAWCLYILAILSLENGDMEAAMDQVEASVRLCNELGNRRDLAYALTIHGAIAMSMGELTISASKYHESLSLFHEIGDKWGMLLNVGGIAVLTGLRYRYEEALVLASAADTLNKAMGGATPETLRKLSVQAIDQAQRSLDPQKVTQAFIRGSGMSIEEVVAMALDEVVD
jgi:non-specific serine/threonine protein kinase